MIAPHAPARELPRPGSLAARALARSFTPPPDLEIWEWADESVFLQNEDASEPGAYRSSKTPWTRRLQELIRRPVMWVWSWGAGSYVLMPVTEVDIQKSSQSGFTEGILNGIRWRAVFRPCNVIYSIDSAEEAKKIATRLLRSFQFLDPSIFTGDDNDIKSLAFQLRGMSLLFYGSFSSGKFANKFADLVVADEVEEHGKLILGDLASRKKTTANGLQVNLSKPKLKGGPINRAFLRGNQEEFFVPCPHCGQYQFLTFFPEERDVPFHEFHGPEDLIAMTDPKGKVTYLPKPLPLGEKRKLHTGRFVFDFCRNLLGKWDRLRVQTETYYECSTCKAAIQNSHKRGMIDRGIWLPMVLDASPCIVSQQMSDFYSEDTLSSFGLIADEYIEASHESFDRQRDFWNHRAGRVWSEEANSTEEADILANIAGRTLYFVDGPNSQGQPTRNIFSDEPSAARLAALNAARGIESPVLTSVCPPYKRGTVPFHPRVLLLGSDVGGTYSKWVAIAVHLNLIDSAVIDWGEELDPDSIRHLVDTLRWPVPSTGAVARLTSGWIDARYRTRDVYAACLTSRASLIPCLGLGGIAARNVKLWSYTHVPMYPDRFKQLTYNDQRAKDAIYIDRIKKKRRRLWFPLDVAEDPQFISELCAEKQIKNAAGNCYWPDNATGNHYGDCLKDAILGQDFLTRGLATTQAPAGSRV